MASDALEMLGADEVAECEGEADGLLRRAGVDAVEPPSTEALAVLLGLTIERRYTAKNPTGLDSDLYWPRGRERPAAITLRRKMTIARQAHAIGHELGHWARGSMCGRDSLEEARCEAIGACLVCPRPAFARAVRYVGHAVHELADMFHTEQALSLLRLGEVTGRPVILLRSTGNIERGASFAWGDRPLKLSPSVAHPIRLDGSRWGAMALAA